MPDAKPVPSSWILSPTLDGVFVLAAPLLALLAAVGAIAGFGSSAIPAILVFHVVATVAHHLPTFIRIYGDVDLFRRYKWSFLLGPLLPFSIALTALSFINAKGYPLETFFYLMIVLTLWDPWHFFMQHYGFMRIYDRASTAPAKLSARFDFWLCAIWFGAMLLLSTDWLVRLLVGLYEHSRIPALLLVSASSLHFLQTTALLATAGVSLAYLGYLAWCRAKGHRVSGAKVLLSGVTFGVMYLAYTPNRLIQTWAPGWSFQVGFAVIGIVHVSQYLAIVWRYNRALAKRPGRARPGFFQRWHAKAGPLAALVYVALCLGYGSVLTTVHEQRWLMALMLALGFTSTLMHYYFDGFIWKVRHAQNSDILIEAAGGGSTTGESWWSQSDRGRFARTLLRQCLYFGAPLGLLSAAAWWVWSPPPLSHLDHMRRAAEANQRGDATATAEAIRETVAAMRTELPIARRLVELQPTAAREASLGLLLYWQAHYETVVIPDLERTPVTADQIARWRSRMAECQLHLERALALPGEVAFPGREALTRADLEGMTGRVVHLLAAGTPLPVRAAGNTAN